MLNRLLQAVTSLIGFAGLALLFYALIAFPEAIARHDDLARNSQRVQARLLSTAARPIAFDRVSNRPAYTYTPVGTFEIVGQAGVTYENVDLDNGTLQVDARQAMQAAERYRPGMVVDAWFDPRSRNDPVFFPLRIKDPAVAAEEARAERRLVTWSGAASLLASAVFALLLFRRQPSPPRPA